MKTYFFLPGILAATLSLTTFYSFAQTVFNSTTGSVTVNGLHFAYSIGEMVSVQTVYNNQLTLTQGFLQPAEAITKYPMSSNPIHHDHNTNIQLYPNPAENFLYINFPATSTLHSCNVFDIAAQRTEEIIINNSEGRASFNIQKYMPGNYILFLTLTNAEGISEKYSFKITKK